MSSAGDPSPGRDSVVLLTRAGCVACTRALGLLEPVCAEAGLPVEIVDVDVAARDGDTALRAEFGDRLPVVLLDGREHSYFDVDVARLRADLGLAGGRGPGPSR